MTRQGRRITGWRFPERYGPLVYGIIQAAVTTAVATAVATYQLTDWGLLFVERWMESWFLAWLTMLPVVILVSPMIHRSVLALTAPAVSAIQVREGTAERRSD
jgi:hypothetical protein